MWLLGRRDNWGGSALKLLKVLDGTLLGLVSFGGGAACLGWFVYDANGKLVNRVFKGKSSGDFEGGFRECGGGC